MEIMWTIVGIIVPLLVGGAISMVGLTPPEFIYARIGFILSAIVLGTASVIWAAVTEQPLGIRLFVTTPIALLIGIGLPESLQWVSKREAMVSSLITPLYNVEVRSAMVYDGPGDLSLYMVGYKSMFGDTASPVFYLAHISITNQQNVMSTVEGYSVAVSDKEDGPWQDLMPISLLSTNLYALGIRNPGTGSIGIPRGAYRLGTPMAREDMAHAALLNASPKLEVELRTPIQPSQTVGGWAAFDLKDHETRGVRNYIRIVVRDSAGKSFSGVVGLPRHQPGDSEIDTQVGVITKVGPIVNISSFHVRYYSDPYRSPKNP